MPEAITLQVPETIYQRLVNTARATRPLEDIVLRVLEVGSPPKWTDVPETFQQDLAALDSLENDALWQIAYSKISENIPAELDALLEPQQSHPLTADEQTTLKKLQTEADRFMLRKAQAVAILRWRGCHVPPP